MYQQKIDRIGYTGALMGRETEQKTDLMKRLAAYLPDPIYEQLEEWATEESRSLSNLVGYLLENAVREREKKKQSSDK